VILACRKRNPRIGFVVRDAVASRVMQMVRDEDVDVGIAGGEVFGSGLEALHAVQDRLCLVYPASHPIGRRRSIRARDIVDLPLVLTDPATSVRAVVDAAFQSLGRQPTVACETTYMMTAVAMVRAGLGVTILPASAREIRAERGLKAKPIDETTFSRQVSLIKKKGRSLPPATAAFVELCVKAMA
jgi:DNA-binding transcriptional LysR family regulator